MKSPVINRRIELDVQIKRPIFAGDDVYVSAGLNSAKGIEKRSVRSLRADTWQTKWIYDVEMDPSELALQDETVFTVTGSIMSNTGVVHAIDVRTGKMRWQRAIKRPTSQPIPAGGLILVGATDSICGLDSQSGKIKWRFQEYGVSAATMALLLNANKSVMYCHSGRTVFALDTQHGQPKWQVRLGSNRSECIVPFTLAGDWLYAGCYAEPVHRIEPSNGTVIWKSRDHAYSWLLISDNAGYWEIAEECDDDVDLVLAAVDLKTKQLKWRFRPDWDPENPCGGHPWCLHGQTLYFSMNSEDLYALDRMTGNARWKLENQGASLDGFTPLTIHDGILLVRRRHEILFIHADA